jgi:hypothetical protein
VNSLKGVSSQDRLVFSTSHYRSNLHCLRANPAVVMPLEAVLQAHGKAQLGVRYLLPPDLVKQKKTARAVHSAVFCEVRVDEALGLRRSGEGVVVDVLDRHGPVRILTRN